MTLAALTIFCWTTLSFCLSFSSLSLICPHLSDETTVHPFLSISLSLSFSLHPELIHLSLADTMDSESAQAPWLLSPSHTATRRTPTRRRLDDEGSWVFDERCPLHGHSIISNAFHMLAFVAYSPLKGCTVYQTMFVCYTEP